MTKLEWLLFTGNFILFSGLVWTIVLLFAAPLIGVAVIDDSSFTISQLLQVILYYGGIALLYVCGLSGLFFLCKFLSKVFGKYFHLIPVVILLLTSTLFITHGVVVKNLYSWIISTYSLTFFSSLIFVLFWFNFYLARFLIQKGLPAFGKKKTTKI